MRPMLNDLELPLVQEIITHERRVLAEHPVPGRAGSHLQDLGCQPTVFIVSGLVESDEVFKKALDALFQAGEPVIFSPENVPVIIKDMTWETVQERTHYVLTLQADVPVVPADTDIDLPDARQWLADLIEARF